MEDEHSLQFRSNILSLGLQNHMRVIMLTQTLVQLAEFAPFEGNKRTGTDTHGNSRECY